MATSRLPATIDALVTTFTAAGIKTWDGAFVTGDYTDAVFVGYDGDPDGDYQTADMNQDWAGIGAKKRDEEFDVICAAVAKSGSTSIKTARDAAIALFSLVENTLRADPSLGFSPPYVAEVKPTGLFTEPTSDGLQARLVFTVHVKTRI